MSQATDEESLRVCVTLQAFRWRLTKTRKKRTLRQVILTYMHYDISDGLQVGGGINPENAAEWLLAGASHVIVTSCLFDSDGAFLPDRLDQLVAEVGKERLVIDLSCRGKADGWVVAMNRWQNPTNLLVDTATIVELSDYCSEFLVHAADVEGKCEGLDERLVEFLGAHCPIPVTYAGGARSLEDLATVDRLSGGKVDLTIGSALDLFGGMQIQYSDCVAWNQQG